jgi:hypothetical protein
VTEFFAPVPLWVVLLVVVVSLPIGILLCMPTKWADRFFNTVFRMFDKKR